MLTLRQRCSRRERSATILRPNCKVFRDFRPLFFVFTTYLDANLTDLFEYFKMKYILVTGGVISGIGKGVISSSIGALLKGVGLHVTSIKIDPYLNIDAGTFSPYEHGKVNNYCFPLAFYANWTQKAVLWNLGLRAKHPAILLESVTFWEPLFEWKKTSTSFYMQYHSICFPDIKNLEHKA